MNAKQKYVDVLTKEKPDLIEVLFEFEADVHPKINGKGHGEGAVFVGRVNLYVVLDNDVYDYVIVNLHEVKFKNNMFDHSVEFKYGNSDEELKLKFEDKPETVEFAKVMENLSMERESYREYIDAQEQ
ncbi:hypothetical protein AMC75_11625 [Staphylococcus carnosus]|uniref:hypothetical protein n=1 Tax=Staphylococcus carnosus TaxID=1281 RepID=UPI0006AB8F80|nr:hypothetical protein [Staphylococcus carnosus]KOR12010.1 hypothetical protein AMC75_11625 [Staphylococcus carnosus]